MNNIPAITEFKGYYAWLSNFYPIEIVYKNYAYPTAEHAYMAQKSDDTAWKARCSDPKVYAGIIKTESYKQQLVDNWDVVKHQVMEEILTIKFSNPTLKQWLIATGDAPLIEGNNHNDQYWGVDLKTLKGHNHLGKLIMKIRYQLVKPETIL